MPVQLHCRQPPLHGPKPAARGSAQLDRDTRPKRAVMPAGTPARGMFGHPAAPVRSLAGRPPARCAPPGCAWARAEPGRPGRLPGCRGASALVRYRISGRARAVPAREELAERWPAGPSSPRWRATRRADRRVPQADPSHAGAPAGRHPGRSGSNNAACRPPVAGVGGRGLAQSGPGPGLGHDVILRWPLGVSRSIPPLLSRARALSKPSG
jgi:hypothetical protein